MGLRDRLRKHGMQDPMRGEFRITDRYFPHPGRTPMQEMLTGVVTVPGMPPTSTEVLNDLRHGKATGRDTLPVLIDRADPSKVVVLWDELPMPDPQADARAAAAREAAHMQQGSPPPQPSVDLTKATAGPGAPGAGQDQWAHDLVAGLVADGTLPGVDPDHVRIVVDPATTVSYSTPMASFGGGSGAPRESATAVITGATEVALAPQDLPGPGASMCDLTLAVTRVDGQTYAASTRQGFRTPGRRAAIGTPGATVPVTLDPQDPADVRIDVATWFAQHPNG